MTKVYVICYYSYDEGPNGSQTESVQILGVYSSKEKVKDAISRFHWLDIEYIKEYEMNTENALEFWTKKDLEEKKINEEKTKAKLEKL